MNNNKRFGKIYKENIMLTNKNNKPEYINKIDMLNSLSPTEKKNNTTMPSMPQKYVFDMDYKTLYEHAMEKLEKYEKRENTKKNNKEPTKDDGEQYKKLYQDILKENAKLKEDHKKEIEENKTIIKELNEKIEKLTDKLDNFNINIENTKEYQNLLDENKKLKDKQESSKSNSENNIEQKYINENNDLKKLEEEYKKQIEELKKELKNHMESSNESRKSRNNKIKDNQKNKELPMLDRYPIKIYNSINNNNVNEVVKFMTSENKIMIEFNSNIANKMYDTNIEKDKLLKDRKIWNELFDVLVEIGEIKGSSQEKTKLKHKIIRCSELYELYGENLSRFKIPISYIEEITNKDWPKWKMEFDELYNNLFKGKKSCEHMYKNGKRCGIMGCRINHK